MKKEQRIPIAIAVMLLVFPSQYLVNKAILAAGGFPIPSLKWVIRTAFNFLHLALLGVVVGLILSALRREFRFHLRVIRSWRWIATTLLLVLSISVLGYEYGILKITSHLVRSTNFDAQLWEIDRWLMLGISPNVFLLEALSHPLFYRGFDWLYAVAFGTTMMLSFVLMFGWRDDRDRIGFLVGSAIIWLGGAWLYLAVPSLGPAYAFYDVWDGVRPHFPITTHVQNLLLKNHLLVMRIAEGERNLGINVHMGIAAFPSLHVAFHAHFAFWLQRLVPKVRLLGWVLLAVVFIGSVITGWHYLVDSVAGLLLAWLGWRLGAWVAGPKQREAAASGESSA